MSFIVCDLRVSIAGAPVLRGIHFEVAAGQTLAIVGRNGAGKTTTLRAIMGLLPVESGMAELASVDLLQQPAHRRAAEGIGYAPEERRLIGPFTVRENLLAPAWAQNLNKSEIDSRMALVDSVLPELAGISDRLGGLISGGQQKIVALGRALMSGQKMVLLDEPFQGLAPALAAVYADALRRLRTRCPQLAIVITESNPSLLTGLSDQTLLLERGNVAVVS